MADLGYVKTGQDFGNQLAGIGGLLKESRAKKDEQAGNIAMQKAVQSGDPAMMTELMQKYPQQADRAKAMLDIQDTLSMNNLKSIWEGSTETLSKNGIDGKTKFLEERLQRLQSEGKNTRHTEEALKIARSGDDDAEAQLDKTLNNAITLAERRGAVDSIGGNAGKFSSKQTTYMDGSVLQGDPTGGSRFYDGKGQELPVGSSERAAGIKKAIASGVQYEYDKNYQGKKGEQNARGETEPEIQRNISIAKWNGTNEAEEKDVIASMSANLPALRATTERLKGLAATASFSLPQKGFNFVMQQAFGVTPQGSTDRERMKSIVNNMILPLLKQTFGASFTVNEKDELKATLLDMDMPAPARIAALEEYMNGKTRELQVLQSKYASTDSGRVAYPEGMEIEDDKGNVLVMRNGAWLPVGAK